MFTIKTIEMITNSVVDESAEQDIKNALVTCYNQAIQHDQEDDIEIRIDLSEKSTLLTMVGFDHITYLTEVK